MYMCSKCGVDSSSVVSLREQTVAQTHAQAHTHKVTYASNCRSHADHRSGRG